MKFSNDSILGTQPNSRQMNSRLMPSMQMVFAVTIRYQSEVRRTTRQSHLSAIVQAQCFSLFGHIVRMSDETDAKKILTGVPLENWRRPLAWPCTTWMKTIQQDLKSKNRLVKEAIEVE